MNLQELQTDFQRIVLDPECSGPGWVCESAQGLSAKDRLAIYHNAYRLRLIDVLQDTFEHTATYLGDDWFQQLASDYVRSHPSTHSNIGLYGRELPGFFAEELPDDLEVAEIARMDWTLRRAFDGADCRVMKREHLQQIAIGVRTIEKLRPVPTFGITRHTFNTLQIWHAIDQDEQPPAVQRLPEPIDVLTWRKGHSPHFRSLSAIESSALACLRGGATLEEMVSRIAESFPNADAATEFGMMLQRWIDEQMLAIDE